MIALGGAIVLLPRIPLFPLMWLSQTLNAILLPVILVLMLRLVNNRRVMREWTNSRLQNILAWGIAMLVTLATFILFFVAS